MGVLESRLYMNVFSTVEMREIFSDENHLQKWLDSEAALARAEASVGVIPDEAATEIGRVANAELFDVDAICEGIRFTWHPLLPMIRQLAELCEEPWGGYVHWGATTQDIMDTGLMLQVRAGLDVVERDLATLIGLADRLADQHRHTLMPGRTHGQHGLPLTFGYKAAVWSAELRRNSARLAEVRSRVNTGNLSGGVGTLASLGASANDVRSAFFESLGMEVPDITWHSARDRIADIVNLIAMIGSTNAKIGNEISQLQRTETAEVSEPFYQGKVGSSTMPQKRNPMASETVVAIGAMLRQQTSLVSQSMVVENERDMRVWMIEWDVVPSAFQLLSGSLMHLEWVLNGLDVDAARMKANLSQTGGLILAESVLMQLSSKIGHQKAHDVVYEVAMAAFERGVDFADELQAHSVVAAEFTGDEISSMLDPGGYVGLSDYFVDQVIDG